jgi:hypoxanthine-DNA glycosylase
MERMATPLLRGFPPIVDDLATVLILGSFPSVQSLTVGQYYANPRNSFWHIMSQLYGFEPTAPYDDRVSALQAQHIALWDVLRECRRAGSADARIDPNSMVVNDFAALFTDHPKIVRVYFNGAKAAQLFARFAGDRNARLHYQRLPSTSPAHAVRADTKLAAWRTIASAAKPGEAGRRH